MFGSNNPNENNENMTKAMQSPLTLSEEASTTKFNVPAYDWKKQTRHDTVIAGKHTFHSMQTFDSNGKPKDAQNDNND
jgi:hypothetical protein